MGYYRLTKLLLSRYRNNPAAMARVCHYLRQPEVAAYLRELNAPYAAHEVMRKSQTCYSFGLGITVPMMQQVMRSEDPALKDRYCIQPGELGGLRFLRNPLRGAKHDLSKRGARTRLMRLAIAEQDRMRNPKPQDVRRKRVRAKGITSLVIGTHAMRLKLLSDGLSETTADAPLAPDKRRLFFCTTADDYADDYHVYRRGDRAITYTTPDGRTHSATVWGNKRGIGEVSIFDANGHLIIEPEQDMGPRTHNLGYFDVSATPPPLADASYRTAVAPQHRDELAKGIAKLAREGMLTLRYENKVAPLTLKPDDFYNKVEGICAQHGIEMPYTGRLMRPAEKRRITLARQRTPE